MNLNESSRSLVRSLGTEDPRLVGVKKRLDQYPEILEQLGAVFEQKNVDMNTEVVAVRTEDVVTFIDSLSRGKLPTRKTAQGSSMFAKQGGEGWYYLTPNYGHSFFQKNSEYRPENYKIYVPFQRIADVCHEKYLLVPRMTAFLQNIVPLLQSGWEEKAIRVLHRYLQENEKERINFYLFREMFYEVWCEELFLQLEHFMYLVSQNKNQFDRSTERYLFVELFGMLENYSVKLRDDLLSFLSDIVVQRQGIIISFSEKILQRRPFMTDAKGDETIVHGKPEMTIHAPFGISNPLDSILSIEAVGSYEKEVLRSLGITRK